MGGKLVVEFLSFGGVLLAIFWQITSLWFAVLQLYESKPCFLWLSHFKRLNSMWQNVFQHKLRLLLWNANGKDGPCKSTRENISWQQNSFWISLTHLSFSFREKSWMCLIRRAIMYHNNRKWNLTGNIVHCNFLQKASALVNAMWRFREHNTPNRVKSWAIVFSCLKFRAHFCCRNCTFQREKMKQFCVRRSSVDAYYSVWNSFNVFLLWSVLRNVHCCAERKCVNV